MCSKRRGIRSAICHRLPPLSLSALTGRTKHTLQEHCGPSDSSKQGGSMPLHVGLAQLLGMPSVYMPQFSPAQALAVLGAAAGLCITSERLRMAWQCEWARVFREREGVRVVPFFFLAHGMEMLWARVFHERARMRVVS